MGMKQEMVVKTVNFFKSTQNTGRLMEDLSVGDGSQKSKELFKKITTFLKVLS